MELVSEDVEIEEAWLKLGKKYMENVRKMDEWRSFITGYVHTNAYQTITKTGSSVSSVTINAALSAFPDPDRTARVCRGIKLTVEEREEIRKARRKGRVPKYMSEKIYLYDFRDKRSAIDDICRNSEHWNEIKKVISICKTNPSRGREVYDKLVELQKEGKLSGFRKKGIDMLVLDSGCDTIVLDRWMIEKYFGVEKTDERALKDIQFTKRYEEARDKLIELVKKKNADKGYGIGSWHVAMWLKTTTDGDIKKAELFLKDLFGQ